MHPSYALRWGDATPCPVSVWRSARQPYGIVRNRSVSV